MVYRNRLHQRPLVEPSIPAAEPTAPPERDVATWKTAAEQWIAEHPGASLGMALGLGVLVAWLIKRK